MPSRNFNKTTLYIIWNEVIGKLLIIRSRQILIGEKCKKKKKLDITIRQQENNFYNLEKRSRKFIIIKSLRLNEYISNTFWFTLVNAKISE